MFSLKDFIKQGFLSAVGKMADYQIVLNAAGWLDKGVLTEEDLMEIQMAIQAQYMTTDIETEADESIMEEEVSDT